MHSLTPGSFIIKMSVVRCGDQVLYPDDVALIQAPCWWNDNLISFWIEHLRSSGLSDSIHLLSPSLVFLISALPSLGGLEDIFSSSELASKSHVIVPINSHFSSNGLQEVNLQETPGHHWSVLVGSLPEGKYAHFDSLAKSPNMPAAELIAAKLGGIFVQLENAPVIAGNVPIQPNGYDCGPYCCSILAQLCQYRSELRLETFSVKSTLCARARESMIELVALLRTPEKCCDSD